MKNKQLVKPVAQDHQGLPVIQIWTDTLHHSYTKMRESSAKTQQLNIMAHLHPLVWKVQNQHLHKTCISTDLHMEAFSAMTAMSFHMVGCQYG